MSISTPGPCVGHCAVYSEFLHVISGTIPLGRMFRWPCSECWICNCVPQGSETDPALGLLERMVWVKGSRLHQASVCSRPPGQAACRAQSEPRTEHTTHTRDPRRDPQGGALYTKTGRNWLGRGHTVLLECMWEGLKTGCKLQGTRPLPDLWGPSLPWESPCAQGSGVQLQAAAWVPAREASGGVSWRDALLLSNSAPFLISFFLL